MDCLFRVAAFYDLTTADTFYFVKLLCIKRGGCMTILFCQQGKYVTSRNLRDRLYRELERNLAMKVEDGETADTFIVSGRGTLHITILIENM